MQEWLGQAEVASYICLGASIVAPIVLIGLGYIYHNKWNIFYADKPNYMAIFRCIWHICDFYSDIVLCLVLYLESRTHKRINSLFYLALLCTFVPYLASNIVTVYFIHQWRLYNVYYSKYINKYDWVIIVISVFTGFYSAIDICHCRLFYWKAFGLQLKLDEFVKIKTYKFWNVVLSENLMQIMIQISYLFMTQFDNASFAVINALLFSLFSFLYGLIDKITLYYKNQSDFHVRYNYRKKRYFKLTIKSPNFQSYQIFSHKMLTKILCELFEVEKHNIQIGYIYKIRNGIVANLEINDFDLEENYDESFRRANSSSVNESGVITIFDKMLQIDSGCKVELIENIPKNDGDGDDHDRDGKKHHAHHSGEGATVEGSSNTDIGTPIGTNGIGNTSVSLDLYDHDETATVTNAGIKGGENGGGDDDRHDIGVGANKVENDNIKDKMHMIDGGTLHENFVEDVAKCYGLEGERNVQVSVIETQNMEYNRNRRTFTVSSANSGSVPPQPNKRNVNDNVRPIDTNEPSIEVQMAGMR